MADDPLTRLRKICLALPESTEKVAWETPTFRIRNKLFAMFSSEQRGEGRIGVWCKGAPGAQDVLVGADPDRFFVPPYVGRNGWIGIYLDDGVDWNAVAALVTDSFVMTAPKRVAALLDGDRDGGTG